MAQSPQASVPSPLEVSRTIAAEIEPRSEEIEEARCVPADIVARLRDAGIFRLCIPRQLGGSEAHALDTLGVIETLSRADGSVGWVVMVTCTTALSAAFLPEEHAQEIYGRDPNVITNGATAPMGRARRVAGGVSLSGRWQWGSGCQHADWLVAGSRLVDADGNPEPDGPPSLLCVLRADQVEILDTWYVSGLSGTGSTDYRVDEAFVPEGRWLGLGVDRPRIPSALYQFPMLGFLGLGVCSVSLGLARRAIDELVALASGKTPTGSRRTLAHRHSVQRDVAVAEACLRSARAFLRESVEAAWEAASRGGRIPLELRQLLRLATTNASMQATKAVDLMYDAAGGSSVYRKSALQRVFRDAHVATQHIMVGPPTLELVGRLFLGLETDTSQL